ncbi:hypothetical protein D3C72_1991910 [compost metagenome]
MHVGRRQPATAIDRFGATAAVGAMPTGNRLERGSGQRVVIGMAAQGAFRQLHRLQRQGCEALLHHCFAFQQTQQLGTLTRNIGQGLKQVEHAATFGQHRLACLMMAADRREHRGVGSQCLVMQFRIATRQVEAVCLR